MKYIISIPRYYSRTLYLFLILRPVSFIKTSTIKRGLIERYYLKHFAVNLMVKAFSS